MNKLTINQDVNGDDELRDEQHNLVATCYNGTAAELVRRFNSHNKLETIVDGMEYELQMYAMFLDEIGQLPETKKRIREKLAALAAYQKGE